MGRTEFEYEAGGRHYVQRPLVFGQVRQLMEILGGLEVRKGMGAMAYAEALGDDLFRAIAVVLREEGVRLRDKDVEALAAELEEEMPVETAVRVVEDFFGCNPIASLLERLDGMAERIRESLVKAGETG